MANEGDLGNKAADEFLHFAMQNAKRIGDSFLNPSKENKKNRRPSTTELIIGVVLAALIITLWR